MSLKTILLIILFIWGIPSTYFRSKFRKIVYQTDDWKINIKPIFITQINYDGLGSPQLFLVNETLKNFCKKNKFAIIKLDEMLHELEIYSFYDTMHTTPIGNKIIANKIFPKLYEIIK